VFATDIVIQLEEDPSDSIAVPGAFLERRNDGFLVSDASIPRVRSYDWQGRLRAAFGRYGDGPFEFRRVLGIVETPSGKIAVIGSGQAGLTYLTADLLPDTLVKLPGIPWGIEPLGPDLLVHMRLTADRATDVSRFYRRPLLLHRISEQGVTWSAFRYPFVPIERPYWTPMTGFPFDVAGDSIYVSSSLRYPVAIFNGAGDSIGRIGFPAASFRPVPVFEPGALSPGVYGLRMARMLEDLNTIERVVVVGSRLVVVHGRSDHTRPMPPLYTVHSSLDIYDRHTGTKLYEDIPLPASSRVMTGGRRHLYLLLNKDFPPWQIAKLRFREDMEP